jgi:hypothetical protein
VAKSGWARAAGLKELADMAKLRLTVLVLATTFLVVTSCLLDSGDEIHGIDGFVYDEMGRPVGGVLIRKTGAESGSTYTRENGYYWINVGRRAQDVVITPVRPGWIFCPGTRSFAEVADRQHGQNFTGYFRGQLVIDGFVRDSAGNPVEGVQIRNIEPGIFSGLTSTTNYLGYYRFNNVIAGFDYEFVPMRAGCRFEPERRTYELPAEDQMGQNFLATCIDSMYIEGNVLDGHGGGVAGVEIQVMPHGVSTFTDENGYYNLSDLRIWAWLEIEIRPEKAGCVFVPSSRTIEMPVEDYSGLDFEGFCGPFYSISGCVRDSLGNPMADAFVSMDGERDSWSGYYSADESGNYRIENLVGGFDYSIAARHNICSRFDPASILVENLDRDYENVDFMQQACPAFRSVSGYVRDEYGDPQALVPVCVKFLEIDVENHAPISSRDDEMTQCVHTDEDGYYYITVPAGDGPSPVVYPERDGCSFVPPQRTYTSPNQDYVDQDFTAYCGERVGISGCVRDAEGSPLRRVKVVVSDSRCEFYWESVYTDSGGRYEYRGYPVGAEFVLTPSVPWGIGYEGCLFCPPQRVYSNRVMDLENEGFTLSCPQTFGKCEDDGESR